MKTRKLINSQKPKEQNLPAIDQILQWSSFENPRNHITERPKIHFFGKNNCFIDLKLKKKLAIYCAQKMPPTSSDMWFDLIMGFWSKNNINS